MEIKTISPQEFQEIIQRGQAIESALVGGGLIFSGITDTCGMGMILARMPWNPCSESTKVCAFR